MTVRVLLALALFALGCGDSGSDEASNADGGTGGDDNANGGDGDGNAGGNDSDNTPAVGCNEPAPSDAFATDAIVATGSKVSCYYAPPLGYCVEQRNATAAEQLSTGGKGAIGCGDAIVRVDADCPTDTAIGRCDIGPENALTEVRYYYPCNQFDGNPTLMSPQHSCESFLKGKYTAL